MRDRFSPDGPLGLAEAAHARVESDPAQAATMAERSLGLARRARDREAEVVALHALGFARRELGDARAVPTLRAAVRLADRTGLTRRAALARRPLAVCLAYRGALGPAMREIDAACAALDGIEQARSEVFRIVLLYLTGQSLPPLAASERALATLRQAGDVVWEARLLGNRGLLLAARGDTAAAEPDLIRAHELFAGLGATAAAFGTEYELTRISLARGDLPACLARLDAIDGAGIPPLHSAELELLRAKALVAGRLLDEARRALEAAETVWRRARVDDPESRLELVRLTLLAGNAQSAYTLARRAQRSFAGQGRPVYAAQAAGLAVAAAIAGGVVRGAHLRAGRRAARTLAAAGWSDEALRVQLSVARAAVELDSLAVARRELSACAALRRHGPVADRIEAWHVEALIRRGLGDAPGAQRAARLGLRMLGEHQATLGASDLRATISSIGVALSRLGLRIALDGHDGWSMLAWADALRASALRLTPVIPPDARGLRDRAAELRAVCAEIRRAENAGRSARSLHARRGALESAIRRSSRHAAGSWAESRGALHRSELARALGGAGLIELAELEGQLSALRFADGRVTRHELGSARAVAEELEWLRFALTRLTRGWLAPAQRETALAGARASSHALGERLIAPLAQGLGDRPLVIVPTGELYGVPWAALPQLAGRTLTVAPSAATWVALQAARPRPRGSTVLVAGPRLRHARREVASIRDLYAETVQLTGRGASAAAVLEALDGAAVAHLACHGRFRADSPLFSALELADGPLNTYELQHLRRPPRLVVLSACDLASADAHPGDELLGFAAALIGLGTQTIIASAMPVPDAAARRLMVALHRRLAAGQSPAAALAAALIEVDRGRVSPLAGFVCLGMG